MECPKCNKPISQLSSLCVYCGFTFGKDIYERLSFYFDIKNELEHLRSIAKNDLWAGLKKISDRIEVYENQIDIDLKNLAASMKDEGKFEAKPIQEPVKSVVSGKADQPEQHSKRPEKIPVQKIPKPEPVHKKEPSALELRVGQKWLLIIGIVTMVFGIGYFLKYSFEQGWIGPAGRVAMAYVWGIILLIAGNQFRKKFEIFGLYLIGGGIATLYFATFAAFQIYHLFDHTTSFFIMVLITILASTLSVIYDTKWLAVLGIAGGFLTPILMSTGQDNQIALMTYMTILNLGLLGIAFYKKWDLLNILGFIFTYILYTAWFGAHYAKTKFWPAIIFLNIFYLIYCIIPFAYQFFRKNTEKINGFLIITPNSFIAFGFSYYMIREYFSLEWVSVISIFYSVLFLLMATYLFRKGRQQQTAFVVLLAKSALFLIITVPIIFSKHWITIFWAAQAITLLWTGIRLEKHSLIYSAYVLISVTIAKFLLYDYVVVFKLDPDYFRIMNSYTFMIAERYITSLSLLGLLYAFAFMTDKASLRAVSSKMTSSLQDSSLIFALWGGLLFIVLNIEAASFFHDYLPAARFAAISVLWTLFSVALMIKGFTANSSALRKVSLGLFFVTLLKVFLFDMSNISTPYRIISFIILGLILVITSYFYHRYKDKIMDVISSAEKKGV